MERGAWRVHAAREREARREKLKSSRLNHFAIYCILYILYIKWNLVVGGWWFVVRGRRFLCTYSTNFLKFFPTISLIMLALMLMLSLQLSSGLTSKNASKKNSPQAAEETAHVNAIIEQSFLWACE